MINKDILSRYVKAISGCDVDPNLTLIDFTLDNGQRSIINLVTDEAKKDKKLANLLDELKYSNDKLSIIEKYFEESKEEKLDTNVSGVRNYAREKTDNYGFINLSSLSLIVGLVGLVLAVVITVWA